MPRLVAEALTDHRTAGYGQPGTNGFVFAMPGGTALEVNNWRRRYWQPAVNAAGLDGLRIHDLRHTAASLAISFAAGAEIDRSAALNQLF